MDLISWNGFPTYIQSHTYCPYIFFPLIKLFYQICGELMNSDWSLRCRDKLASIWVVLQFFTLTFGFTKESLNLTGSICRHTTLSFSNSIRYDTGPWILGIIPGSQCSLPVKSFTYTVYDDVTSALFDYASLGHLHWAEASQDGLPTISSADETPVVLCSVALYLNKNEISWISLILLHSFHGCFKCLFYLFITVL